MKRMRSAVLIFTMSAALAGCGAAPVDLEAPPDSGNETIVSIDDKPVVSSESESVGGTVQYERVWVSFPTEREYWPDIKVNITNTTDKAVVAYHEGMLVFDNQGMPLEIIWNGFNDDPPSFHFLCDWHQCDMPPHTQLNWDDGGWALFSDASGAQERYREIAYVIFNFKQITFDDGSVWENPDFEDWRDRFEGKQIDLDVLERYYPHVVTI